MSPTRKLDLFALACAILAAAGYLVVTHPDRLPTMSGDDVPAQAYRWEEPSPPYSLPSRGSAGGYGTIYVTTMGGGGGGAGGTVTTCNSNTVLSTTSGSVCVGSIGR